VSLDTDVLCQSGKQFHDPKYVEGGCQSIGCLQDPFALTSIHLSLVVSECVDTDVLVGYPLSIATMDSACNPASYS
jgi:hypothetical protein